jgi:predicted transcriptional regulator of viral defense system
LGGVGSLCFGMRNEQSPPPDLGVAELAGRQWGVVASRQLVAAGLSRAGIVRRVRAGRLHPIYRGVYAVGHEVLSREGRWMAAVLACGEGAVLSHVSAAAHWELLSTAAARIDVTAAPSRHGAPGIRLHRSRSLDARDTTTHRGIPVTTRARTLLDLAATVAPQRLERAIAQAERLRLYDDRAIQDHRAVQRTSRHGRPGAGDRPP